MIPKDDLEGVDPPIEHLLHDLSNDSAPQADDAARIQRAVRSALVRRPRRLWGAPLALCAALAFIGLSALAAELASSHRWASNRPPPASASPPSETAHGGQDNGALTREPETRPQEAPATEVAAPLVDQPLPSSAPPPSPAHPDHTIASSGSTSSTVAELFAQANEARRAGDFSKAAALYARLESRFPDAPEASLARVSLGRVELDQLSEPAKALAQFDAYLAAGGPLEEEAMVGRAQALGRMSRGPEERAAWAALLTAYPRSVWAHTARERSNLP
jgi:hypothetical protein